MTVDHSRVASRVDRHERDGSYVEILGTRVDRIDLDSATGRIVHWIDRPANRPRFAVVSGFHGLWVAHKDPVFQSIVNAADLFCADGIAPVWLSRLLGLPLPGRVPGPSLMALVLEKANEGGYSSFFFGDSDDTLSALRRRLEKRCPGHRIAGMFSPPFRRLTDAEDEQVVRRINAAEPDVLWVALGLPKQEIWIHEHLDSLDVPVVIGVGAAFGFLSGRVSRAPQWVGDAGFEWAWRLAVEPKKLWRRDLIDGPQFLFHALREVVGQRRRR